MCERLIFLSSLRVQFDVCSTAKRKFVLCFLFSALMRVHVAGENRSKKRLIVKVMIARVRDKMR